MPAFSISRLEEKIQLLLKKLQYMREENSQLQDTVHKQTSLLQQEQHHVKELEDQMALLKIASAQGASGNRNLAADTKRVLRSTINEYIHEIDNCIAKLHE